MRLWSIHPKYLDAKGLVALWRETLLAQKVLKGETKGYKNHPQLIRFKIQTDPLNAMASYLTVIVDEANSRGYKFDSRKIAAVSAIPNQINVTSGQLIYEFTHLKNKLINRDQKKYNEISEIKAPEPHPLFNIISGEVEPWEIISQK